MAFHCGLHLLGPMQSWIFIWQTIFTCARSFTWTERSSESTMFMVQIALFPPTSQGISWAGAGQKFKQAPWLHFWVIVSMFRREFVNHYSIPLYMQVLFKALRYEGSDFQRPWFQQELHFWRSSHRLFVTDWSKGKKPNLQDVGVRFFYGKTEEACVICSSTPLVTKPVLDREMEVLLTFLFNRSRRRIRNPGIERCFFVVCWFLGFFFFKNVQCLGKKQTVSNIKTWCDSPERHSDALEMPHLCSWDPVQLSGENRIISILLTCW